MNSTPDWLSVSVLKIIKFGLLGDWSISHVLSSIDLFTPNSLSLIGVFRPVCASGPMVGARL